MPEADELTAIRSAGDLDRLDEAAWSLLERNGWVATPQLLFALKDLLNDEILKRAQSLKAKSDDNA